MTPGFDGDSRPPGPGLFVVVSAGGRSRIGDRFVTAGQEVEGGRTDACGELRVGAGVVAVHQAHTFQTKQAGLES